MRRGSPRGYMRATRSVRVAPVGHARDSFVVAAAAWTLGEDEGAGGIMAGNGGVVSTWTTRSARC